MLRVVLLEPWGQPVSNRRERESDGREMESDGGGREGEGGEGWEREGRGVREGWGVREGCRCGHHENSITTTTFTMTTS